MILDFIIIIFAGLVGGILAKKLNQPTVVGYLAAGFFASIFLQNNIKHAETIDFIAQIGIAFLLFTIGIELSFARIAKVYKIAVLGGILQIILTILIYKLILSLLGISSYEALFLASCFSLSSTAVVVKILNEKAMLETLEGEILVAWLLVQDLAVVPLLILLPIFRNGLGADILSVFFPLFKGLLFIFLIVFVGKKISAKITFIISSLNSKEILLLASICLCLLTAYLTEALGLSFMLGAFLGGVIIAETTENQAVISEIRPLRDLFTVVFFVSLPLLINIQTVINNLSFAIFLSLIVIFVKFLIVILISLYFGYHSKVSFVVAAGLIQVGEFAFVIAREGKRLSLISKDAYSLVLSVTMITILLTPFLFNLAPKIYSLLKNLISHKFPKFHLIFVKRFNYDLPVLELPYQNHVVLCGFGRMGKYIGRALELSGIAYLVIEIDRTKVATLRSSGIKAVYGDSAETMILDYAQVDKAKLLILAIPDFQSQKQIIAKAKTLNRNIKIISRTHFEDYQKMFKALGADFIVQPEFTAAIEVIRKIFRSYNIDSEVEDGRIARIKIEHGL